MNADAQSGVRVTMSHSQLQDGLGGPLTKLQRSTGSIHGYGEFQNAACGFCVLQVPENEVGPSNPSPSR